MDKPSAYNPVHEGLLTDETKEAPVACSACFKDHGLYLDAEKIGYDASEACPNCGSKSGKKLTKGKLEELAFRFFWWGSVHRFKYGAAPAIVYNQLQKTSVKLSLALERDVGIFGNVLGLGFFDYGPRAWMYGEITPLKALQNPSTRPGVIDRILHEYPAIDVTANDLPFYRVRKSPSPPYDPQQYDSPPDELVGKGRMDAAGLPALYASPDLETCVHECRVTVEDELYVATLKPRDSLHLINLAVLLREDQSVTEFESLDLAVHMLFLAGDYSFEITRAISAAALGAGYDGVIYPSYFSLARHGGMPFQAVIYGISNRRIPQFQGREEAMTVQNLAVFGRPIREGKVAINCINKLVLTRVSYQYLFGPVPE